MLQEAREAGKLTSGGAPLPDGVEPWTAYGATNVVGNGLRGSVSGEVSRNE